MESPLCIYVDDRRFGCISKRMVDIPLIYRVLQEVAPSVQLPSNCILCSANIGGAPHTPGFDSSHQGQKWRKNQGGINGLAFENRILKRDRS